MPLQDETQRHFFHGVISVDDLLSDLGPCPGGDLMLIEKRLRVLPNRIVFDSNDQSLLIYVHRSGRVGLCPDAKATTSECPVGPGFIYGLVEALAGTTYGATMRTLTNSEFDVIDRDKLLLFIQSHPALSFRLAKILSHLYQQALKTIKSH